MDSATQSSNWARFFLATAWLLPCLGIFLNSFPSSTGSLVPPGTGYFDSGRSLLSLLCFLGFLFSSPKLRRPHTTAGFLGVAFLGWGLLSSFANDAWFDSLLFWQMWPAAAMFYIAARRLGGEALGIETRTAMLHLPLAVIAGTALLPIFYEPEFLRIGGIFELAGVLANWLLLLLPICLYDAMEQRNWHAVAAATASTLALVAIGYSFSRASWVLVCLELGLILLLLGRFSLGRFAAAGAWVFLGSAGLIALKQQFSTVGWALAFIFVIALPTVVETVNSRIERRHLWRLLGLLAVAAVLGWGLSNTASMQSVQEMAGQRLDKLRSYDNSSQARIQLWRAAIDMSLAHPVLGVGPGDFSVHYPQYQKVFYYYSDSAHSASLELAGEVGLVGLALFSGCLLFLLRDGLKTPTGPLQRTAYLALFCGLGYAQIDLAYQFGYLWLTIAAVYLLALPPPENAEPIAPVTISQGIIGVVAVAVRVFLVPTLWEVETARRLADDSQALLSYQRGREKLPWWRHAALSNYQYLLQQDRTPSPEETQQLLDLGSDTSAAHAMVGEWHLEAGRYQEAVREYQTAVSLDPFNHPNYYAKLRQLGTQLSDPKLVESASKAVLENYPLDKIPLAHQGHRIHLQAELQPILLDLADTINPYYEPEKAEPLYRFVYDFNPSPRAAFGLGISLQRMGRSEEAYPYLLEAHEKNPKFPKPRGRSGPRSR